MCRHERRRIVREGRDRTDHHHRGRLDVGVGQLLEPAGPDALAGRGGVHHDGGRRVGGETGLDQLRHDRCAALDAHQHHQRAAQAADGRPVDRIAVGGLVAGDDRDRTGDLTVRDGDAGGGRAGERRADARHDPALDARLGEHLHLFATAAEQERVAALQAHDSPARACVQHEQFVEHTLGVAAARALADVDEIGVGPCHRQDLRRHQPVVQHHVGLGDQPGSLERQQLGITRARAHQPDVRLAHAGAPTGSATMPAPTVPLVTSSITMKLPIVRFVAYASIGNGSEVMNVTVPISLSPSSSTPVWVSRVATSRRSCNWVATAFTVRVPCFNSTWLPARSGLSAIHATRARICGTVCGASWASAITSPRDTSSSCSSCTRTAGALPSTAAMRLCVPDGSTTISWPTCGMPAASEPGVPAALGRDTRTAADSRLDDELHRQAQRSLVVAGQRQGLEVLEQARAVVPGRVRRRVDHVAAVERAQRDRGHDRHVEAFGERGELVADLGEPGLAPVDEVHLVDGEHEVLDAEQRRQGGVAQRLLAQAVAGVDEDDRDVGGGRTRDHVARVLHVARRVGDHERTQRRREVAVGDVDRDALLALGAQAVGDEGEVEALSPAASRGGRDGVDHVVEQRLGVVQQATDQRALAVVDGPGGGEAQQLHQKYPSRLRSSIAASLNLSSARVAPRSVMRLCSISVSTSSGVAASLRTAPVHVMSPTVR